MSWLIQDYVFLYRPLCPDFENFLLFTNAKRRLDVAGNVFLMHDKILPQKTAMHTNKKKINGFHFCDVSRPQVFHLRGWMILKKRWCMSFGLDLTQNEWLQLLNRLTFQLMKSTKISRYSNWPQYHEVTRKRKKDPFI